MAAYSWLLALAVGAGAHAAHALSCGPGTIEVSDVCVIDLKPSAQARLGHALPGTRIMATRAEQGLVDDLALATPPGPRWSRVLTGAPWAARDSASFWTFNDRLWVGLGWTSNFTQVVCLSARAFPFLGNP